MRICLPHAWSFLFCMLATQQFLAIPYFCLLGVCEKTRKCICTRRVSVCSCAHSAICRVAYTCPPSLYGHIYKFTYTYLRCVHSLKSAYTYMHTYTHTYTHTCKYIHTYILTYLQMRAYFMHSCICTRTYMHAEVHSCACLHTHTNAHIYIYICICMGIPT
jgi:hypothetical protein